MPKKRFGAEQIVTLLRQIVVSMARRNQADHAVAAPSQAEQLVKKVAFVNQSQLSKLETAENTSESEKTRAVDTVIFNLIF
jgi:hypothetical protein